MDTMSWSFVLFGAIPEAMLMIALGLELLGKDYSIKQLSIIGLVQGGAAFFIRKYATFGLHMGLQGITLVLLTCFILRKRLKISILAVFLAMVINALIETPYSIFILWITGWSFGQIISSNWIRILYISPKHLIFLLLLLLCKKNAFMLEEEVKKFGFLKE